MRAGQVPAFAGAVLLHAGVALLVLNGIRSGAIELQPSAMVVSLVPKGPSAAPVIGPPQPLEAAPAEAEETPAPPEPTPVAPPPPPTPSPTAKTAAVKPPVKPPVAPSKKPAPEVDPCALVGTCATPNRAVKRPPAAPGAGTADSQQTGAKKGPVTDPRELNGLVDKVGSLWQLDCEVGQTRKQVVKVQFTIMGNGQLAGRPQVLNRAAGSVFADAAGGAVRAVQAGAPYSLIEVPSKLRNVPLIVNFHAAEVCSSR